jgi:hypothetical protein
MAHTLTLLTRVRVRRVSLDQGKYRVGCLSRMFFSTENTHSNSRFRFLHSFYEMLWRRGSRCTMIDVTGIIQFFHHISHSGMPGG